MPPRIGLEQASKIQCHPISRCARRGSAATFAKCCDLRMNPLGNIWNCWDNSRFTFERCCFLGEAAPREAPKPLLRPGLLGETPKLMAQMFMRPAGSWELAILVSDKHVKDMPVGSCWQFQTSTSNRHSRHCRTTSINLGCFIFFFGVFVECSTLRSRVLGARLYLCHVLHLGDRPEISTAGEFDIAPGLAGITSCWDDFFTYDACCENRPQLPQVGSLGDV